jgi:hypothetical protein
VFSLLPGNHQVSLNIPSLLSAPSTERSAASAHQDFFVTHICFVVVSKIHLLSSLLLALILKNIQGYIVAIFGNSFDLDFYNLLFAQ